MKVVIDSNVLVSIIGKRSRLRPIWDAFIEDHFSLAVSEDILKEYGKFCKYMLHQALQN